MRISRLEPSQQRVVVPTQATVPLGMQSRQAALYTSSYHPLGAPSSKTTQLSSFAESSCNTPEVLDVSQVLAAFDLEISDLRSHYDSSMGAGIYPNAQAAPVQELSNEAAAYWHALLHVGAVFRLDPYVYVFQDWNAQERMLQVTRS